MESNNSEVAHARNELEQYLDDLQSLAAVAAPSAEQEGPPVPAVAVLNAVADARQWLHNRFTVGNEKQGQRGRRGKQQQQPAAKAAAIEAAAEVWAVHERLKEDMAACGAALQLELRALDARESYLDAISRLAAWMSKNKWHSTAPSSAASSLSAAPAAVPEAEKVIISDMLAAHTVWSEEAPNVMARAVEFNARRLSLEVVLSYVSGNNTGGEQLKREFVKHLVYRAARLRDYNDPDLANAPELREEANVTATLALEWLDEHADEATSAQLADKLQAVQYGMNKVMQTPDIATKKNELETLLDRIETATTRHSYIAESLGPTVVGELQDLTERAREWLNTHSDPSFKSLNTLFLEVRTASANLGLSDIESVAHMEEQYYSQQAEERGEEPQAGGVVSARLLAFTDAMCALAEEAQSLRVACVGAGGGTLKPQGVAFANDVVRPLAAWLVAAAAKEGIDEAQAEELQAEAVARFRICLEEAVAAKIRVPPSCWSRLGLDL